MDSKIEEQNRKAHEEAIMDARAMRDFADSAVGKGFVKLLKQQYSSLVEQACVESKYAGSLKALEVLGNRIGATLDRGESAREILERLTTKTPKEDW